MSTIVSKAEKIRITTNIEGTPLTVTINGKTSRVARIYQQWHESDSICSQDVSKAYFRIKTTGRVIIEVYRDSISGLWYLDKVCK